MQPSLPAMLSCAELWRASAKHALIQASGASHYYVSMCIRKQLQMNVLLSDCEQCTLQIVQGTRISFC